MSRMNHEDNKFYNPTICSGLRLQQYKATVADQAVIDPDSPPHLVLDAAGNVEVLLPESTAARAGLTFLVTNLSASTITLADHLGTVFTTSIVLATMESCWIVCTGNTTQNVGWFATGTASSA